MSDGASSETWLRWVSESTLEERFGSSSQSYFPDLEEYMRYIRVCRKVNRDTVNDTRAIRGPAAGFCLEVRPEEGLTARLLNCETDRSGTKLRLQQHRSCMVCHVPAATDFAQDASQSSMHPSIDPSCANYHKQTRCTRKHGEAHGPSQLAAKSARCSSVTQAAQVFDPSDFREGTLCCRLRDGI